MRQWLETLDADPDPLVPLAWLAAQQLELDEDELHGPLRRAVLLLAAGGDPHRGLELDGRAVTALADELDRPELRADLVTALLDLRLEAAGLAAVTGAVEAMLADGELAVRALAAGLLAAELAES